MIKEQNKNLNLTSPFPKGGRGNSSVSPKLDQNKSTYTKTNNKSETTPTFTKRAEGIQKRYLPYNKNLKRFSRNLRNDSTRAEIKLWQELRAAQLGYTFNRQKPLLNFIADFYCKPLHLIIEVDGMSHWGDEQIEKDKIRQEKMEELGLHFLRFDDEEVWNEIENVIRTIEITIEELEELYPEAKKRKKHPK